MPKVTSDAVIVSAIKAYIASGANFSEASTSAGVDRGSLRGYVRKWEAGQYAGIPGMPPPGELGERSLKQGVDSSQAAHLKRQIGLVKAERDALLKEREENQKLMKLFSFIQDARVEPPAWTVKRPKASKSQAIATAFLSDVHLDEVVKPEQINYVNEYDRKIAETRLKLFFENTIELSQAYLAGLKYEGLVLPLGGDLFSGIIHEELTETNAGTIFESLLYWSEPLMAGIRLLRDAFGRVFIPCVVGNHGRRQRKPHAKNRAQDNFDWFFYHLIAKLLKGDKGIDFAISDSADQPYSVFETRYLLTHGDQFRGGSGIAGMLSPLMIGDSRKRARETAVRRPYDYMLMGHWHQLAFIRGLIINGSVKGYDEYAYVSNFAYEPAQQAFWVTDPMHGITIKAPIHVVADNERYGAGEGPKAVIRAIA